MKNLSNYIVLLVFSGGLLFTACGEKSQNSNVSVKSLPNPRNSGESVDQGTESVEDPTFPNPAVQKQIDIVRDAQDASAEWSIEIEGARSKYSGKELDEFLYNYAKSRAHYRDFDRVGFIEELKDIRGPGAVFTAILTSIYSGPLEITPSELLREINGIQLSPVEQQTLASSIATSPVFVQSSLQEMSELLTQASSSPAFNDAISASIGDKIFSELQEKSPEALSDLLAQYPTLRSLNAGSVVDRSAQSNPGPWWDAFVQFCAGESEPASEMIASYSPQMISGFMKHKPPVQILGEVAKINNPQLQNQLASGVASKWASFDAGEVAKWAGAAPDGSLKDVVVFQLALKLDSDGLKDEARGWAETVIDRELALKLKERGLVLEK